MYVWQLDLFPHGRGQGVDEVFMKVKKMSRGVVKCHSSRGQSGLLDSSGLNWLDRVRLQ